MSLIEVVRGECVITRGRADVRPAEATPNPRAGACERLRPGGVRLVGYYLELTFRPSPRHARAGPGEA